MNFVFFCLWQHRPAGFNSRNGLHNCEHDPSYLLIRKPE